MGDNPLKQIRLRPVQAADLAVYKALRLEALQSHPEAFGSDFAEQSNDPDTVWTSRIRSSAEGNARIIFAEIENELVAMVAVYRETGVKTRHSASISSVYVRPQWRGRRVADMLIHEALTWCAVMHLRIVRLSVASNNVSAIRCYLRCGFQVCGLQPEVIRLGEVYYDELTMWRRV